MFFSVAIQLEQYNAPSILDIMRILKHIFIKKCVFVRFVPEAVAKVGYFCNCLACFKLSQD